MHSRQLGQRPRSASSRRGASFGTFGRVDEPEVIFRFLSSPHISKTSRDSQLQASSHTTLGLLKLDASPSSRPPFGAVLRSRLSMHLQSLLALALLASPLAHAANREPVDETLVNSSLFERCKSSPKPFARRVDLTRSYLRPDVASHLKSRRYESPESVAKPAVYKPRKIDPPVKRLTVAERSSAAAPAPLVRSPNSHLSHAVWKPYIHEPVVKASEVKAEDDPSKRSPLQAKKDKVEYRLSYFAQTKKRGDHILNHASSLQRRSAKERPVSNRPAQAKPAAAEGGLWLPYVQPNGEEDWSWMNAESAEGDDETGGNLKKRSRVSPKMRRSNGL